MPGMIVDCLSVLRQQKVLFSAQNRVFSTQNRSSHLHLSKIANMAAPFNSSRPINTFKNSIPPPLHVRSPTNAFHGVFLFSFTCVLCALALSSLCVCAVTVQQCTEECKRKLCHTTEALQKRKHDSRLWRNGKGHGLLPRLGA